MQSAPGPTSPSKRSISYFIHTTLGRGQGTSCPASCPHPVDHKVSGGDLEDLDLSPSASEGSRG